MSRKNKQKPLYSSLLSKEQLSYNIVYHASKLLEDDEEKIKKLKDIIDTFLTQSSCTQETK